MRKDVRSRACQSYHNKLQFRGSLLLLVAWLSGVHLCKAGNDQVEVKRLDDAQLEPGKLIERELAGGEIHSYQVLLVAGQFLHVVVDQKGIDVSVNLSGPDGNKLLAVDNSNSTQGSELILFIAQASGRHTIEVQSLAKRAQVGRYGARIHELRTATPRDSKQITATRVFIEAETLRLKGTTESYKSSLEKYYEAWPLMKEAGDQKGEAYTLYYIGVIYYTLQDSQKALEHFSLAVPLSQAVNDLWLETTLLSYIAQTHSILGEKEKALEHYSLALSLARRSGIRSDEALIHSGIGLIYNSIGEYQQALKHYSLALSIFNSLNDGRGQANVLNNIGLVYDSLGAHQKALEYYSLALPLRREAGDKGGEAITLNNMGASYRSLGEYKKALEHYGLALLLLQALGNKRVEGVTLNNIGFVHVALGEYQKALEYYSLALPLRREAGDKGGEAGTLKNIGLVHASSGDNKKALDYYNQSLRLSVEARDRNLEATTRYLIAREQRSQNNLVEARSSVESALDVVESLRAKVASPELRASYFSSVQQYYDFYISLLMRLDQLYPDQGYDAMALHASERARARILLEMLTEARVDIQRGAEPHLLERERSLKQLLDAKTERQARLLGREQTQQQAEQIDKEVEHLLAQYQEVQDQIKLKSPGYAALTQPRPLTLKEIQREVVDADTLLLEYALGEEQSYLWAVTQDSIVTFRLPKRAEIEEAAQRVYDLLSIDQRRRPAQLDGGYTKAASAGTRLTTDPSQHSSGSATSL